MGRRIAALCAGLAALLLIPLIATTAGADPHPGHEQQVRDDGPAAADKGVDRGNPNGNNGTIKLDGVDVDGGFENHPNNEPHIGCVFEVDLYGLDEGDTAIVEFWEWNPTADKDPIYTLDVEADGEGVGEDGAGGGVDLDDDQLVDLSDRLVGKAHPQHGHHVRVEAMITSGDDTYRKIKTFWTGICASSGSDGGSGS